MKFLFNSYERLSRKQYSMIFAIASFGGAIVLTALPIVLPNGLGSFMLWGMFLALIVVVYVVSSVKRLNDAGISSGFGVIALIPWIGFFFMLWLCCVKTEEPNQHGVQEPW
jgi:uncharacterized membrane protein YhaH (DUF805 family)